ncbi:histidine kinase [Streptomyces sp. NBC_01166]|uniref:sensor histidine kinase n=1 Tax=Streptomyces sp. NBC_01166 TaxID=2903755 RepID=UPI003864CDCA|nr:histidine kinase [Streptomyces sp. NBC_01166]
MNLNLTPRGNVSGERAAAVLVPAAVAVSGGLSLVSPWWAAPTVVAAFLTGRGPGRTGAVLCSLAAVLAAGVVAASLVPPLLALGTRFVGVMVLGVLLPWFAGRFWRQYQELARAGWERAERLERERQLVAGQARLAERARIAQDMHDVLGHDLSLIALSAGALQLAPGLDDRQRRAAKDIRARAATAVERLGGVIGVLSEDTDAPPLRPHGRELTELVGDAAESGLRVELRVDGEADGLPPVVARAVHRVVQEALTNVARHAPRAAATVQVRHTETETEVVVVNGAAKTPAGRPPGSGGRGLIGLDERVRLAGGTFEHGPRGDGFAVSARLPHRPPARVPDRAAPEPAGRSADGAPAEFRRARRRAGRTLATALLVPLGAGAVLGAAVMGWDIVAAARSTLDPGDYARLRVGQDRAEVQRVLPDRQSVHRPSGGERPEGRGVTCEYYAMTADRFDSRSGDAYRLCFRDDTLVSLDALAG